MSEVVWRTSSRSAGQGDCVEVAALTERVLVRDSKHREGIVLAFTSNEWRAFTDEIDRGGFDL